MKFKALSCLMLLVLFACSNTLDSNATGKNNQKRDALRIQARASADLMLAGDYEAYVKTLHPKIVKKMGGYQTTVDILRDSTEKMKADGFNLLDISFNEPSRIINEGKEDVAVIPMTMIMGSDSLKMKQSSYLVSISAIDSNLWFFMSGQGLSKERLKVIYPKLASSVEIPEIRNSVMDQDEEKAFSKYLDEKIDRVEQKEGKPFSQILDEKISQVEKREGKSLAQLHEESKLVIKAIEENGLRQYIENGEGKSLENIPTRLLIEILKEHNIKWQ